MFSKRDSKKLNVSDSDENSPEISKEKLKSLRKAFVGNASAKKNKSQKLELLEESKSSSDDQKIKPRKKNKSSGFSIDFLNELDSNLKPQSLADELSAISSNMNKL